MTANRQPTAEELSNANQSRTQWEAEAYRVNLRNDDGTSLNPGGMGTETHDYTDLTYTGTDLTKVEYYLGGSGGTLVATITMTYSAGILQTITKT